MTVELADGTQLHHFQAHPRGSHVFPLTRGELVAKFRTASSLALGPAQVDELFLACNQVGKLADIGELVGLMLPA